MMPKHLLHHGKLRWVQSLHANANEMGHHPAGLRHLVHFARPAERLHKLGERYETACHLVLNRSFLAIVSAVRDAALQVDELVQQDAAPFDLQEAGGEDDCGATREAEGPVVAEVTDTQGEVVAFSQ